HPLVFTHNDFAPRNVMVEEMPLSWKVTGIIDWEWLPPHWEYCKSTGYPRFWGALT
ncbi:hypothetical protein F5146DRAFT_936142, partial [Armillaria mellea]